MGQDFPRRVAGARASHLRGCRLRCDGAAECCPADSRPTSDERATTPPHVSYDRLAQQLGRRFSRTAQATVVVRHVLQPVQALFNDIIERYEGQDPIVEVGLALGRSRLEPINAQLVFILDGELSPELRAQVVDWWQPLSERARADGLELLAPRFVSLDELTAREYRQLDMVDASSLSPEPEDPPDPS